MPTLVETKNKANTEIQVRIKNLIECDGFTQKQIADKIDVSQPTLSLYLKNEYAGDIARLEEQLLKLLEDNKAEKVYKKVKLDFVKTTVSAKLFNIAQICQFNGEIALCTGSSGLGKTTSINQYAKEHSGVIIIDPDEGIGVRSLLYYFCKPLRIEQGINESNVAFCEKVVKKLKNSNKLIIVDEAENLDISCFRVLRKIHDRCKATCGLLFVGTETLANKLSKLGGEYDYLFTRFGYIDSLDNLTQADVKAFVTQIFPNCSDELVNEFNIIARCNARILFNLLKRTADMAASSKEPLNKKMIRAAGKYVGAARNA